MGISGQPQKGIVHHRRCVSDLQGPARLMLSESPSSSEDEQKQANHNDCKLTQKFSQFAQLFLLTAFQPILMHGIKHRKGDIGNRKYDQRFENYLSHGADSISPCARN